MTVKVRMISCPATAGELAKVISVFMSNDPDAKPGAKSAPLNKKFALVVMAATVEFESSVYEKMGVVV